MDKTISEDLKKNLIFLGISLILIIGVVAVKNVTVPEESVEVGYTEVTTECNGLEVGFCLGLESRSHTTYNYDNYQEPEEGSENYYRRIESELMIRAYNTCNSTMEGMDWTSHVSYMNKTGDEWLEYDEVNLLPCEKTFYRNVNASS